MKDFTEQSQQRIKEIKEKIKNKNKTDNYVVNLFDVTNFLTGKTPKLDYNNEVDIKIYAEISKQKYDDKHYTDPALNAIYSNVTNFVIKGSPFMFEFDIEGEFIDVIVTEYELANVIKFMIDGWLCINTIADMSWDWNPIKLR